MKVLLVLVLSGACLQEIRYLTQARRYTTGHCLLTDAAIMSFLAILTVSFLFLRPRQDPPPRTWRRRHIALTILIGALLFVTFTWLQYFEGRIIRPKWGSPPANLPAYTQAFFLTGLIVSGATTAAILGALWMLDRIPKPLRQVAAALLIGLTLVGVDQAANDDNLDYSGPWQQCVKCSAGKGVTTGTFHGWFEYHEGERPWLQALGDKEKRCTHVWGWESESSYFH